MLHNHIQMRAVLLRETVGKILNTWKNHIQIISVILREINDKYVTKPHPSGPRTFEEINWESNHWEFKRGVEKQKIGRLWMQEHP